MGVQQSKSKSKSKSMDPEEKRKKELAERGILLPPLFVLGYEAGHHQGRDLADDVEPNPSLLARLRQESLSYSILSHYLKPGLSITSHTTANGSVSASLVPNFTDHIASESSGSTGSSSTRLLSDPNAMLCITNHWSDRFQLDFIYASKNSPTLYATILATPYLKFSGKLADAQHLQQHESFTSFPTDTKSTHTKEGVVGWLSCQYRMTFPHVFQSMDEPNTPNPQHHQHGEDSSRIHLHFGTYLDLHLQNLPALGVTNRKFTQVVPVAFHNSTPATAFTTGSISAVHGYASLQVPGCFLAVEGKLPNTCNHLPTVSYLSSVDLTTDGPPLTVTLLKTPTCSSFGFSQILQWDRWILNPMEVTCPKIRNTLCWTVELETTKRHETQNDLNGGNNEWSSSSSLSTTVTTPKAGMVWQVNRALALKIVAQPLVTGAIIVKRWQQPRVVCSALFGQREGRPWSDISFQGLSFQLEIGDTTNTTTSNTNSNMDYFYKPSTSSKKSSIVSPNVPPTKSCW